MYKLVILVRQDLKMPLGKACVQCAHAAVDAVLKSDKKIVNAWLSEGGKKSVLKVADEKELHNFLKQADNAKLKTALITDAGKTFFPEPTTTVLAIGPDLESKIDTLTAKLKMI
ncbi:MAG: aminoacyl-tRNA hydrolase [Candidatus Woesearchaeota archaeon]